MAYQLLHPNNAPWLTGKFISKRVILARVNPHNPRGLWSCGCCCKTPYAGKPKRLVRLLKKLDGWRGGVCGECRLRVSKVPYATRARSNVAKGQ
jgi:hypothetical protein